MSRRADAEAFDTILVRARLCANLLSGYTVVPEVRDEDDVRRLRASGGTAGMQKVQWLSSSMYGMWTRAATGYPSGVMSRLHEHVGDSVEMYRERAESPAAVVLPAQLASVQLALDEADVARWGERAARRSGLFWVVKDTAEGAVFVADSEDHYEMYRVLGIAQTVTAPIERLRLKLPVKVSATLLPFRGRIMYDGVMHSEKGFRFRPEEANADKASELFTAVQAAEESGAIVSNLSAEGPLSENYRGRKASALVVSEPESVTVCPAVAAAAARVAELPKCTGEKETWLARCTGYTEQENLRHLFLMMSNGMPLGAPVETRRLNPTATELAEALADTARRHGGAPGFFLVDAEDAIPELKEAFGSNHAEPTTGGRVLVMDYAPPSEEETRQVNNMSCSEVFT